MSAPYFLVEHMDEGSVVALPRPVSRHALRSLRLRPGDEVTVTDGEGTVASGRLVSGERGGAMVQLGESSRVPKPAPRISVALSPPSGERLSWAVQKLGELGTDELVLLETERSVRRWKGGAPDHVLNRLRVVAEEASMQSRRAHVMRLLGTRSLRDALTEGPTAVMFWEGKSQQLDSALPPDGTEALRLFVGPEGGFTDEEVALARRTGASLATLGPNILRTETAAVVGTSLVMARYGRLG